MSKARQKEWDTGERSRILSERVKRRMKGNLPHYTGSKHPGWKGGVVNCNGYYLVLTPNHPFAKKDGYVKRSRLTMEKHIGRYLTSKEVVHHINGDKGDDKIENLYLFSSTSEHTRFHCFKNRLHSGILHD